jgi:predicted kinase
MSYKQKKAFILIGASGSGKSTVRKQLEEKLSARTFSLDDCRINFYLDNAPGYDGTPDSGLTEGDMYGKAFKFCNERSKEFDEYVDNCWNSLLITCDMIIVDNVNGTRKSRAKWVDGLRKKKFHIVMLQMQTPLDVIIERQQTRGDKCVPAEVVRSQYMRQEEPMIGSECDEIIVVNGTQPWNLT